MKKCYLLFITLLYISISLPIMGFFQGKQTKTFSLKNSDKSKKPKSIYFIAVNGRDVEAGLLRVKGRRVDRHFDTSEPTRLYIWEENIENRLNRKVLEELKRTALENHNTSIEQMNFDYKPDLFYEFPKNKTIHVKWKEERLEPREGKSRFAPKRSMGKYTKDERYSLKNNVTQKDIDGSYLVFDEWGGRWLDSEAMRKIKLEEKLREFHLDV